MTGRRKHHIKVQEGNSTWKGQRGEWAEPLKRSEGLPMVDDGRVPGAEVTDKDILGDKSRWSNLRGSFEIRILCIDFQI